MASAKRIQRDLEQLRDLTSPCEEGTTRLSYTPAYRQAADYLIEKMQEAGLETREDHVGNIYGVRRGKKPGAPKIISGSHLDTVKCSGYFDGQAGIICALEAARLMQEHQDILNGDYEVVATIMEEGARFPNLTGSRLAMGEYAEAELDSLVDEDGVTLREAIRAYGLPGDTVGVSRRDENVRAFLEVHMEQGTRLERNALDIGLVETIWGCRWYMLTAKGVTAHPSTPLGERQDAMQASAKLISRIADVVAQQYAGRATVTFGKMELYPGNINAIASRAQFSVDFRAGDPALFDELDALLFAEMKKAEAQYRVSFTEKLFSYAPPTPNSPFIVDALENATKKLGCSSMRLYSGAGHDAMIFGIQWPIGMLFLPSRDGVTHCKEEWTDYENVAKAADVLYLAVKEMDSK